MTESEDVSSKPETTDQPNNEVPEGLWIKCSDCGNMVYRKEVRRANQTCPECAHHFPLSARNRIKLLLDDGSFEEKWPRVETTDPLEFEAVKTYKDKLKQAQEKTGMTEAILTGTGTLKDRKVVIGVTDRNFIMGSMGSVVGEKVCRCLEYAEQNDLPFIMVSGSGGGARMYEGALSLMQMAKTSAAAARFHEGDQPFISVLTNATMAGVLASFASLGDLLLAEPGALIGFTGPRVIKQTINKELPEGFQRSEFLLEHGFIDRIVSRNSMREELAKILYYTLDAPR